MDKITRDEYIAKENAIINKLNSYLFFPFDFNDVFKDLNDAQNQYSNFVKEKKDSEMGTGATLATGIGLALLTIAIDQPFRIVDIIDVVIFFFIGLLLGSWIYNMYIRSTYPPIEKIAQLNPKSFLTGGLKTEYQKAFDNQVETYKSYYKNSKAVENIAPFIAQYFNDIADFLRRYSKFDREKVGFKLIAYEKSVELRPFNITKWSRPQNTLVAHGFDKNHGSRFYNTNMNLNCAARMALLYAICNKFDTSDKFAGFFVSNNISLSVADDSYFMCDCSHADNFSESPKGYEVGAYSTFFIYVCLKH